VINSLRFSASINDQLLIRMNVGDLDLTEQTGWKDRARAILQWWRVPLMTAVIAVGIYFIQKISIWLWIGMAVTLGGELIQMWAAAHLKKDAKLAVSGPYAYVRNPMYIGRFFVLLGFALMVQGSNPNWSAAGIPLVVTGYIVIFALYVVSRVGREEARLKKLFGEDYNHYCSEINRFMPKLRRYSKASLEGWQWSKLTTNHEHLNLIAAIAVFAIILLRLHYFNR